MNNINSNKEDDAKNGTNFCNNFIPFYQNTRRNNFSNPLPNNNIQNNLIDYITQSISNNILSYLNNSNIINTNNFSNIRNNLDDNKKEIVIKKIGKNSKNLKQKMNKEKEPFDIKEFFK